MRKKSFTINLTQIEGEGIFPCPKCGTLMSPDDETEDVYTIVDTQTGDDENLESVIIQCNKCKSHITLEGFDALSDTGDSRVEISEALPGLETGLKSSHTVSLDKQSSFKISVEYAQKEEVEAFKRLKNLHIGDAFKGTLFIEKGEGEVKTADLAELVKAIKKKFKGLKDRDIYIVQLKDGEKNVLGRASNILAEIEMPPETPEKTKPPTDFEP
ncbi:hypothetical protein MUP77_07855 [Candidatus Bathyarchaeota archaeon]|nr:hypothetical protein [Candidatus Bathyarchaeota archaeon]